MSLVLFLDFDGVLHPDPCKKWQYFCQLPLIESVLRDHQQVEVVISSTWRYDHSLEQLRAKFSPDIQPRVIGITPSLDKSDYDEWIPSHLRQHHREWECRKWLRQHRVAEAEWLAVDDVATWFEPACERLVVTISEFGFQTKDAATLTELLNRRHAKN